MFKIYTVPEGLLPDSCFAVVDESDGVMELMTLMMMTLMMMTLNKINIIMS